MHIGFTGTRHGMTIPQRSTLIQILMDLGYRFNWHHGDCIGADEQSHEIVSNIRFIESAIYIHPPTDSRLRAYCSGAIVVHPPLPYIERNHEIVRATQWLIAAPAEDNEKLRSGTWATIRYAQQHGRTEYRRITQLLRNGGICEL